MLDGNVQEGVEFTTRLQVCGRKLLELSISRAPDALDIVPHNFQFGPVRWLVRRQSASNRIDSEGKQTVKFRTETLCVKHSLAQQIPIKGLKMADIENYAVA